MEEVESWKVVACVVVFFSGLIGSAISPLLLFVNERQCGCCQAKAREDEDGNASGTGANEMATVAREDQRNAQVALATMGTPVDDDARLLTSKRVIVFLERLLTSVGCGVMISIGLVHLFFESQEKVDESHWVEESEFPLAPVLCLVGALLTYFFHTEIHFLVDATSKPAARMHMMEFGIFVHSVLIGIVLGTAEEVAGLRGLTIALIFHQLCEGFALGATIVGAAKASVIIDGDGRATTHPGISVIYQCVMVVLFALSTPVGVIVGWFGLTSSAESEASNGTQGVLLAFAAGILICSALADFMPSLYATGTHHHSEAVSPPSDKDEADHHSGVLAILALDPNNVVSRLILHFGVLLGAAAMCILAVYGE